MSEPKEVSPQIFLQNLIGSPELKILDVRAPVEFADGAIPQSVNIPLLSNEQRAVIGTCYKSSGREAAIQLGYQLMEGAEKQNRQMLWKKFLAAHPGAYLTCFRGGLRSKISQQWISELGYEVPRLRGGTKALRQLFSGVLQRPCELDLYLISGKTGSGKSRLLTTLSQAKFKVLDLETLANHRGSAFGGMGLQPTQVNFENRLALEMLRAGGAIEPVFLEDESRMIGKRVVPESLFVAMRAKGVYLIEETLQARAELIFEDYVVSKEGSSAAEELSRPQQLLRMREDLKAIRPKLGGLEFSKIDQLMMDSIKKAEAGDLQGSREVSLLWILRLLQNYYDPLYDKSLKKRNPKILERGTRRELQEIFFNQRSTGR